MHRWDVCHAAVCTEHARGLGHARMGSVSFAVRGWNLCCVWTGSVLFRGRGCAKHGQHPCPCTVPNPALSPRRLERLQRIVSKLQMESGLCEEQLNQADTLLQSVRGGRGAVRCGGARCGAAAP